MPFTVTAEVPFRVKGVQYLSFYLSSSEHCGIPVRLPNDKHNQWRHMHQASKLTLPPHARHSVSSFVLGRTNAWRTAQSYVVSLGLQQTAERKMFPVAYSWTALRIVSTSPLASRLLLLCSCRSLFQISTPRPTTRKFVPGLQSPQGVLRYQTYIQVGDGHFHIWTPYKWKLCRQSKAVPKVPRHDYK